MNVAYLKRGGASGFCVNLELARSVATNQLPHNVLSAVGDVGHSHPDI